MAYTGNSIVDYLKSVGKPSDYASRSVLAKQYGITNYIGSAEQNTQLLNTLNKPAPPITPITPVSSQPVAPQSVPVAPTQYAGGLQPDDPKNKYNTATGQLNPNYSGEATPTPTPALMPTPTPAQPAPAQQPTSTYTGVSIVDYLKSVGQASDYPSREKLAQQYGIANYTGTAQQNTQLLNTLRGQATQTPPTVQPSATGQPGAPTSVPEAPFGAPTSVPVGEQPSVVSNTAQKFIDAGYSVEDANQYAKMLDLGSSLFAPQETQEQKDARTKQQASLDRLIALQEELAKANVPSQQLIDLNRQIAEQQKVLNELTPKSYLETQPGLKDIGITQGYLERRVAAERDPIASGLANLLMSQSFISAEENQRKQAVQAQIEATQTTYGIQKEMAGFIPSAAQMPTSIQSKILESFLFPEEKEKWSEPYLLGGDYVQKSSTTGQIRTAVNVPAGGETALTTAQKKDNEIARIKSVFSKPPVLGSDGYVDPYVYIEERQNASGLVSSTEFDNLFKNLVNPLSANLVFYKPKATGGGSSIDDLWNTDDIWNNL